MCDYSLHHVASRPATVGDKLVTTKFVNTPTGGFAALDNANVAVCLRPGTELAFERDLECGRCSASCRAAKSASAWRVSGKSTWSNLASITTRWNSPTVKSSW